MKFFVRNKGNLKCSFLFAYFQLDGQGIVIIRSVSECRIGFFYFLQGFGTDFLTHPVGIQEHPCTSISVHVKNAQVMNTLVRPYRVPRKDVAIFRDSFLLLTSFT